MKYVITLQFVVLQDGNTPVYDGAEITYRNLDHPENELRCVATEVTYKNKEIHVTAHAEIELKEVEMSGFCDSLGFKEE